MKAFFAFVFLLPLWCLKAQATELSPLEISKTIFPQTKTWTNIEDTPKATQFINQQLFQPLKDAYLASGAGAWSESKDCSFIERVAVNVISKEQAIHAYDIDEDGDIDYVYTGSAQCAEGHVTLFWFQEDDKFVVKQEHLPSVLALSTNFDGSVQMASYSIGCCADTIDEYQLGFFDHPMGLGRVQTPKKLAFPDKNKNLPTRIKYKVDAEFTLRSEPSVSDAFNEWESNFMSHAVFGNVLSKYLAGCEIEIISHEAKENGDLWRFVYVPEECDYLKTHAPFKSNFGWAKGL